MAVVLRMARHGRMKRPFYRIIAAEKSCRRDGRYIEVLGTYNPMKEPKEVLIKEDRIKHWVEHGAKPSRLVRDIIVQNIPGFIESKETAQREKIQERRKQRKQRKSK